MSNLKRIRQRLITVTVSVLFICAAACALTHPARAQDEQAQGGHAQARQMRGEKWVLFSDVHLFAEYDWKDNGHAPNHNFAQARTAVLAEDKPAGFVITGDAASFSGTQDDYRMVVTQLEPITAAGIPVYVLMGNHDKLENLNAVAPNLVFDSSRNWQATVVERPYANLFMLDSYVDVVGNSPPKFGKEQLEWLAAELDKRRYKPAILISHFNLSSQLLDYDEFWEIVKSRPQVKAYIHGHTHMYTQDVKDDVHLVCLPALGWGPWLAARSTVPVGWTVAALRKNGIDFRLHTVNIDHELNGDLRRIYWLR